MASNPAGASADVELDQAFVDLVAKGEVKIPPYPAVAFRVEALVQTQDFGIEELSTLVASDQALSADIIRCANSAVYSRGAPVASVKQAVSRVGSKEVARIALASALAAHALAAGPLASLRRRVWLDALASAVLCNAVAKSRRLAADVAFSAGLLHDFGKVLAIACLEEIAQRRRGVASRAAERWEEIVERYHVELGVVIAARWKLPELLADAISQHHDEQITAADPRYVQLVATVDRVLQVAERRARVGAEDLTDLGLDDAERELAARTIEMLPEYVASFEAGNAATTIAAAANAPTLVEKPAPMAWKGPPPPPFPVVLRLGGKDYSYKLLGLGGSHCMVTGPNMLPENLLLELKLACDPPIKGFASVKIAWPEKAGGFTLLVQPFGLQGPAAARWKELAAARAEA